MLLRYIISELIKLRRTLVLLLCVAAPTSVAIISILMALRFTQAPDLEKVALGATAIWAYMMLPLTITATSVLLTQIEHGASTWNHLLTVRKSRPYVYLAKLLVLCGLIVAMSAILWLELVFCGMLLGIFRNDAQGHINILALALLLSKMATASLLVATLQLWVALRYKDFVKPLILGIVGTFIAVAVTSAPEGAYFPWLMAVNMLAQDPARQQIGLIMGFFGGLGVALIMLIDLSHREN